METTQPPIDKPTITRHDFFRIVGTSVGVILLTHSSIGCAGKSSDDPMPSTTYKVDFSLRLADKGNENLTVKGGYMVVNDLIVAQTKDGKFIAVSANCTCTPQGTLLSYKSADNYFLCPLHLSRFDATGKVLSGPATQPLTQYVVEGGPNDATIRIHS